MWVKKQREASEGRVYAGLTLYRGRESDIVRRPLASVEVQFTQYEGEVLGFTWLGWGHNFQMLKLPDWYGTRRLHARLSA
jgi:hypothetical protein